MLGGGVARGGRKGLQGKLPHSRSPRAQSPRGTALAWQAFQAQDRGAGRAGDAVLPDGRVLLSYASTAITMQEQVSADFSTGQVFTYTIPVRSSTALMIIIQSAKQRSFTPLIVQFCVWRGEHSTKNMIFFYMEIIFGQMYTEGKRGVYPIAPRGSRSIGIG